MTIPCRSTDEETGVERALIQVKKQVSGTTSTWVWNLQCSTQVYNHFECRGEKWRTQRQSMLLRYWGRCCSWDLRMRETWDETKEVGLGHPRRRLLCEQRFCRTQCREYWESGEGWDGIDRELWGQPVYYFNSANLFFDFKIHSEGSCFISFYFSDHLTPERGLVV